MPLILSGSVDISGSMTATTILVSSPGAGGMVSSSQQIQNYNLFAVTSSANTFYGNQTINGDLNANIGGFSNYISLGGTSGLNTYGTINAPTGERMILNSYHGLELKTSGGIGSGTPISILKIDAGGKAEITGSINVNGTFRTTTPNRSFFITSNAYSISDGTLSSGFGMDGDGLYLGNVASSTGWTISNPQVMISSGGRVGINRLTPDYPLDIYAAAPSASIGLKTDSQYNTMIRDYTVTTSSTLDISTERLDGGAFNFLMLVSSTLIASAGNRNYYTFAVQGRGTTGTATQLTNVSAGTSSRTAISVSFPSNGVIRLTLTGGESCQIKVTAIGHGAL